jgi:hypothetical protein
MYLLSYDDELTNKHFSTNQNICSKIVFNNALKSEQLKDWYFLNNQKIIKKLDSLLVSKNVILDDQINVFVDNSDIYTKVSYLERIKNIFKGVK